MENTRKSNLKKQSYNRSSFLLLVAMIACNLSTYGNKNFHISFSQDDFEIVTTRVTSSTYEESVICKNMDFKYPGNGLPSLPLLCKSIIIDKDEEYVGTRTSISKHTLPGHYYLTECGKEVPVGEESPSLPKQASISYGVIFPDTICKMSGITTFGNCKMIHYIISPFEYNSRLCELSFIDMVDIEILTSKSSSSTGSSNDQGAPYSINPDIIKNLVINKADLDAVVVPPKIYQVDYLLITDDYLKHSFDTLLQWKKEKGLKVATETIDHITSKYEGNDLPLKIKNCIKDYYTKHGLKYVLLGGDTEVVPTRYCYIKECEEGIFADKNIPTDKYYACFGGVFDWNKNGDQTYGDWGDGIDLSEYVYITRIPVQTESEAKIVSEKIVDSEKNPKWNGNILLSGVMMNAYDRSSGKSDSEILGERMYNELVKDYLPGNKTKFYDTGTDFPQDSNYDLTAANLLKEINKGYSFIDMITHGTISTWKMEKTPNFTSNSHAANVNSDINTTLITTVACNTNRFDSNEISSDTPCLSETLIRNANSGVVAYLGSSRFGWQSLSYPPTFGTSLQYEQAFYQTLFSDKCLDKNFGRVVSLAKMSRMPYVTYSSADDAFVEKWVHFALNPIGDPEMPIFTNNPKEFTNAKVQNVPHTPVSSQYVFDTVIDAGEDGCRICICSESGQNRNIHLVYDNVRSVRLDGMYFNCIATITKQNFKPKQLKTYFTTSPTIPVKPTGKIISCQSEGSDCASVKVYLPEHSSDAKLIITNYESGEQQCVDLQKAECTEEIQVETKLNKTARSASSIYVISLVVDGSICDSARLIK